MGYVCEPLPTDVAVDPTTALAAPDAAPRSRQRGGFAAAWRVRALRLVA